MRVSIFVIALAATGSFPAVAQVRLPAEVEKRESPPVEVGGTFSAELLTARADQVGIPLRYGNVRPGSERVEVNGRTLKPDIDYYIDYPSGTLYLKLMVRDREPVRVDYRYDEKTGSSGTFGVGGGKSGFAGIKFELAKGTSVNVAMGLTERLGDGTVVTSNVYGMANSFGLGQGTLKGVAMFGDRRKANSVDMFGLRTPTSEVEEGKGKAIVQDFEYGALGGKITASYQEADDRFSGFQALSESGVDPARVQQMSNEKGLKRSSFGIQGVGGPSLGLTAGLKQVGDDQGSITWRNYAGKLLGTDIKYEAFKVDEGFNRFASISETDREQLSKERGFDRQSVTLDRELPGGAASFSATRVEDTSAVGISRRIGKLETPQLKAHFSDQHVDQSFTRFGDLREGDRDQLAREAGLSRQAYGLSYAPGKRLGFGFDTSALRTETGDFVAQDARVELGPVTLEHGRREVAPGFAALGNMTGQEVNGHVGSALNMMEPGLKPNGDDPRSWGGWAGLNRSFVRLGADVGKGMSLIADRFQIDGQEDSLSVERVGFKSGILSLGYREQSTGEKFNEVGRLMKSENDRLGRLQGFSSVQLDGKLNLWGGSLTYERMSMGDMLGGAGREAWQLDRKGVSLRHVTRLADAGFSAVRGTADPERDRFAGMLGFDESQTEGKVDLTKSLSLEGGAVNSENNLTGETRAWSNMIARWSMDRFTQILARRAFNKVDTPEGAQVDQNYQSLEVSRDFGKLGKVKLIEEKREFDGLREAQPDSVTQGVTYTKALNSKTSVSTEHSRTRFENGDNDTLTSHSVATALTPKVGVSVTDTNIKRDGDRPDESHRSYGFWVDFGKNIRLNWNSKRDLVGESQGTLEQRVSVTPGEFQGIKVGAADYQRNGWDDQRDKHVGKVSLSNVKPLSMWFMDDVRFHYAVDTVRDQDLWQRELRTMGFGGRVGSFAFGFDYRSQALPSDDRAIDRQFSFTTDVTGKSWLRGDVKYNLRTLPYGQQVMVRNYSITAEPFKGWVLNHSLLTNPLQQDGNVILGDRHQETRTNKWSLQVEGTANTKIQASWEEFMNENSGLEVGAARFGLVLNANNPSPLLLEYVLAQTNEGGEKRRQHGFNIRYDQRPGPNQSLSFRFGNTNWELARPGDQKHQNWNLRLDYSVKF
ncbi:MAG: hypothetical protein AB7F50_01295 [Fimbriimonadaceae bacterium]